MKATKTKKKPYWMTRPIDEENPEFMTEKAIIARLKNENSTNWSEHTTEQQKEDWYRRQAIIQRWEFGFIDSPFRRKTSNS